MSPMRFTPALALAQLLAGCSLVMPQVEPVPPDAGLDEDIQPIGPVVEIGRGDGAQNGPWRYEVYESRIGTCTRITFVEWATAGTVAAGRSGSSRPVLR